MAEDEQTMLYLTMMYDVRCTMYDIRYTISLVYALVLYCLSYCLVYSSRRLKDKWRGSE